MSAVSENEVSGLIDEIKANREEIKEVVREPLVDNNPITLQVLGICSALAVTSQLTTTLTMCVALTAVTAFSSASISLIRMNVRRLAPAAIITSVTPNWSMICPRL